MRCLPLLPRVVLKSDGSWSSRGRSQGFGCRKGKRRISEQSLCIERLLALLSSFFFSGFLVVPDSGSLWVGGFRPMYLTIQLLVAKFMEGIIIREAMSCSVSVWW